MEDELKSNEPKGYTANIMVVKPFREALDNLQSLVDKKGTSHNINYEVNPHEVLEKAGQQKYDLIISSFVLRDVTMPDCTLYFGSVDPHFYGTKLLSKIKDVSPETLLFIYGGRKDLRREDVVDAYVFVNQVPKNDLEIHNDLEPDQGLADLLTHEHLGLALSMRVLGFLNSDNVELNYSHQKDWYL